MIDYRVPLPVMAWQVTAIDNGRQYTTSLYASSVHEARVLGAKTSQRPLIAPAHVIDVCLLEIAKARQQELVLRKTA